MSVTTYEFFDPGSGLAWRTGSMSPSPLALLGPFRIAFDTPGLTTGVPLVTLPTGSIIYDIGVVNVSPWDGTTPQIDVGEFTSANTGLFADLTGDPVDLTEVYDTTAAGSDAIGVAGGPAWLAAAVGSVGAAAGNAYLPGALYVFGAAPLVAVVSVNGQKSGTATGATTGFGYVYVLAATPFLS